MGLQLIQWRIKAALGQPDLIDEACLTLYPERTVGK